MKLYRIEGIALDWVRSYLRIVHSDVSLVVPQGTILGPLLFLIYINDLPNCLTSCQPRMYADDTRITYADVDVNSIQLNLNHDLGNLNKWLISNKLTLNTAKTEFMLIGHFRVPKTLTFKMRLGTQPFLWKWVLFAWEWKIISISKAEHLPSFWNRGSGELGNGLLDKDNNWVLCRASPSSRLVLFR